LSFSILSEEILKEQLQTTEETSRDMIKKKLNGDLFKRKPQEICLRDTEGHLR